MPAIVTNAASVTNVDDATVNDEVDNEGDNERILISNVDSENFKGTVEPPGQTETGGQDRDGVDGVVGGRGGGC